MSPRIPAQFLAVAAVLPFLMLAGAVAGAAADAPTVEQLSLQALKQPWKGDLDGMVKRGVIRVLVTYNRTNYFLESLQERGITYDVYTEFQKHLNKALGRRHVKVQVVFLPVARDELLPYLAEGRGDIAAANLTVTESRKALVDFADPVYRGVRELVVASSGAPVLVNRHDLSGKTVAVRRSSSYFESLERLNEELRGLGRPPVRIEAVDENLETEDLLEMVNAGLVAFTVADSHLAAFWRQVFTDLRVYEEISLRQEAVIAPAVRKGNPQLKQALNEYIKTVRKGTLLGNILFKRYLQNTNWVRNSMDGEHVERFQQLAKFLKKYADTYDFDWLMVAALGYQESQLDQSQRSSVGAVGVMQILPSTAESDHVGIPDIYQAEQNIHAGTKYLRWIYDHSFRDADMDPVNKMLFTFASYNAGFARVAGLREKASAMGLDPNLWFRNVEVVAAREIGRETVQYVSNIFKYYLAYTQLERQRQERATALETVR